MLNFECCHFLYPGQHQIQLFLIFFCHLCARVIYALMYMLWRWLENQVPSISSTSPSKRDDNVVFTADGLWRSSCGSVWPVDSGVQEPIVEARLDVEVNRNCPLLLLPLFGFIDDAIVSWDFNWELMFPDFLPMLLPLNLLENIRVVLIFFINPFYQLTG